MDAKADLLLYGNAAGGVIAVQSELGGKPAFGEARLAAGEFGYASAPLEATLPGRAGTVLGRIADVVAA